MPGHDALGVQGSKMERSQTHVQHEEQQAWLASNAGPKSALHDSTLQPIGQTKVGYVQSLCSHTVSKTGRGGEGGDPEREGAHLNSLEAVQSVEIVHLDGGS